MRATADPLITALAAFVVRQSAATHASAGMVSGIDRIPGSNVGLTVADRQLMAQVSRRLLQRGRADIGAEVHELLHACTRPLQDWFDEPEVRDGGLQRVVLIDADAGMPSIEARDLARGYDGYLPDEQAMLFREFMTVVKRNYADRRETAYTQVREWVIRHPLATSREIASFLASARLKGPLLGQVLGFYEQVPAGWAQAQGVAQCAYCGNALAVTTAGRYRCRTQVCADQRDAAVRTHLPLEDLQRVKRALMVYWINPGLDEIALYEALKAAGLDPRLYPDCDAVDIAVGDIGIDLKAYASPELLADTFSSDIGGLAAYRRRIIVIPDRLLKASPSYLDRLKGALQGPAMSLECRTVSSIQRELTGA